jgi:hypothetical protein
MQLEFPRAANILDLSECRKTENGAPVAALPGLKSFYKVNEDFLF